MTRAVLLALALVACGPLPEPTPETPTDMDFPGPGQCFQALGDGSTDQLAPGSPCNGPGIHCAAPVVCSGPAEDMDSACLGGVCCMEARVGRTAWKDCGDGWKKAP